jgi:hypothetical protein
VTLGAATADDEDLVLFDGSQFTLLFDGSAAGVPEALDLDAVHYLGGSKVAVSFDGSGSLPGVVFDREDVLEHDLFTGTWEITYDGSAVHAAWGGANLDAVAVPEPDALLLLVSGVAALLALGPPDPALSPEAPARRRLPGSGATPTRCSQPDARRS